VLTIVVYRIIKLLNCKKRNESTEETLVLRSVGQT